ncbi:TPA: ABC transporter substrate-binding protein [Enterococcus faecium]
MKLRKQWMALSVATLAITGLAACGEGNTSSGNKNEILLWSSATGPDGEKIKKNIDEYNRTNPDFPVKFVSMAADTFTSRLTTAGKSGRGVPDIALVASEAFPTYKNQDMLETWNEMIADTELKKENYVEIAWEVGKLEEDQYGIPATMGSWIMYYNKDLVEKYHPQTLDDEIITYQEIEEAGQKAKEDGIYSYGYTWGMQNYSNLYQQMGGEWLDSGNNIDINNEHSYRTVEEFKKLHDNKLMVPEGEDANKLFLNQRLLFLPEGTWMLGQMEKISDFQWGATFTPQWDAENLVQGTGVDQFAMFKTREERSDDKKAGMVEFLTWLQSNQLEWIKSGANPTSLAMLENESYTDMPQSFLLATEKGQEALSVNDQDGLSYVFAEYDNRSWDMITGKADIKETFEEIQKVVDEKMK